MTETPDIGTPHVDPVEADVFTGDVPAAADVGQPDNLGTDIGIPAASD
jgi:hypothetical protein